MSGRKWFIALAIVFVLLLIYHTANDHIQISAGPTQHQWFVADYPNATEAAQKFERINNTMIEFMRVLKAKYYVDETQDVLNVERVAGNNMIFPNNTKALIDTLLDNYNPEVFYENDPRVSSDTSYTISKGTSMHFCLRNRENPMQLVDDQTLIFVWLHEMAHCANPGWGHGEDFWTVFKFILHEAQLAGIYTPIDYKRNPVIYCGLKVEYQPLFDPALKNLWETAK